MTSQKRNKINKRINNKSRKSQLTQLDLYNFSNDYPINEYGFGSALKNAFSGAFNQGGLNSIANVGIGSLGSTIGKIGGDLIAGGKSSGVGNAISNIGGTLGSAIGAANPVAGAVVGAASGVLGGITNAAFGSKLNEERIAQAENEINAANSFNANANNFDDLTQQLSTQPIIAEFNQKDIGSDGWFSNKAEDKYNSLLAQKQQAEAWVNRSVNNNVTNLQQQQMNNLLQNYAAYGGLLDMDNQYSDGGKIYIKPENRGKFTALKERTGKSATWFKEHGTPAQRKMATFALNARKWKHKDGGILSTHGLDLSNGVTYINNGNTHENNRYEGVQMGVDSEGVPNLVEEGEVIFNDYVFSNRIKVPDTVRNKYKLRGTKDMTFAAAAKKASKESEERPNDPVSQRGLEDIMNKLANEQEAMREQRKNKRHNRQYAEGGDLKFLLDAYNESLKQDYNDLTPNQGIEWLANPHNQAVAALTPVKNAATKKGSQINSQRDNLIDKDNLLRYAPAFGSALGVGYGLLSKPDYSRADALAQFAQNAGKIAPISYEPIGDYLTYRPTDMNYIANRMAAQAGATRRNIMNTSGGNRANAIGSLLAADYNSQIAQADAIRQGEDANWNRLMQTATFNRGTNQYNSEAALKAAIANQEARMKASQLGLSSYATAMQMKDAIDAQRNTSINANLTNLFDSLGDIGREEVVKKMIKNNPALLYDYFGRYKGNIGAEGGKLNKKKRGGFTY